MNLSTVLAAGGATAAAVVALAFAGVPHAGLDSSPVARMTSPTPTASATAVESPKGVESPDPAESPVPAESPDPSQSPETSGPAPAGTHPCNHGFYVSQAAHLHKGGQYVSSVGKSDLGKNGACTAPLPQPAP
jgi:hypothetical protein